MARYQLRDRRAARRIMDAAGGFRIGSSLFVRVRDLLALEDRLKAARRSEVVEGRSSRAPVSPQDRRSHRKSLAPRWWEEQSRSG